MGVFIIAEAGVNHNGDINKAFELIDVAIKAGVDAVKFQFFSAEGLVSKTAAKAQYQKQTTNKEETQYEMLKRLELSKDDYIRLDEYCKDKEIMLFATAFDFDSIDFLHSIDIPIWKVPSGEVTNLPYLEKIAKYKKPIIMSTGMCDITEISQSLEIIKKYNNDVTLLHCNTEYPTPYKDVNLRAMNTIKKVFNVPVGYSDHTSSIEVSIAAVALGACVIEKHFTLDKNMEGPDHLSSLEPDELKAMAKAIRNIEKALGNDKKEVSESEARNKETVRKSIVAKTDILQGEVFSEKNITAKRPGRGISPMRWYEVIGKKAKQNFKKDEVIFL